MSQLYDLEFNKDDVVLRNIIVGVLATLNNKMWWYQQVSETEKQKVQVPFYFSTTGDERFLMDMFMNTVSSGGTDSTSAESVYNQLPRAILQLDGISIDAGSLTNKFVRAFYQRVQDDGTLKAFNSEVFMVPLKLSFTVDLYVDSSLDVFKGIQRTIEIFYKNNVFQIDIDGTRIPAVAQLPEDFSKERPIEFSFGDKKEWKINYSIEVQTFMPIFKNADNGFSGAQNTEMFAGTVMDGYRVSTNLAQAGGFTPVTDPFNPNANGSNSDANSGDNNANAGQGGSSMWIGSRDPGGQDQAWPINPSGFSNPLPPPDPDKPQTD
jgi:hypothetical protein